MSRFVRRLPPPRRAAYALVSAAFYLHAIVCGALGLVMVVGGYALASFALGFLCALSYAAAVENGAEERRTRPGGRS